MAEPAKESELARDPARMHTLKKVLGKTETELYLLEGDVSSELVKAFESDQAVVRGQVVTESGEEVLTTQIKDMDTDETLLDLEKLIRQLEKVKKQYSHDEKQRWDMFAMRLQGFSVQDIAIEYERSVALIYAYLEWCTKQLPKLKDYMQEFTTISMQRLEAQYRQLAIARAKGDILAHKVSLDIIDQQAKLAGAHKVSIEVDNRVTYVLEGVDMEGL